MEAVDITHDYRDDYTDEDLEYERERRGIRIARQIDEWVQLVINNDR